MNILCYWRKPGYLGRQNDGLVLDSLQEEEIFSAA
jgi:hypothetical protein